MVGMIENQRFQSVSKKIEVAFGRVDYEFSLKYAKHLYSWLSAIYLADYLLDIVCRVPMSQGGSAGWSRPSLL